MKIVLASSNRNKYREMKEAFGPIGVELIYGGDTDVSIEVDETGDSYEENALAQSKGLVRSAWQRLSPMTAVWKSMPSEEHPGAFGPCGPRQRQRQDDVAAFQMEGAEDRRARFVSCIAVVFPDKEPASIQRHLQRHHSIKPSRQRWFRL